MRKPKPARPARVSLTVRLAEPLHRWLAHQAIDEHRDMAEILTEALEAYRARVSRGAKS